MDRRTFVSRLGAATVSISLFSLPSRSARADDEPGVVDGTPIVYAPTADSATVVWSVNKAARGALEFGETEALGDAMRTSLAGFAPRSDHAIKARLSGLKPGTKYFVRTVTTPVAGGEDVKSPVFSFKTLNPNAAETRFLMWNDTHDNKDTLKRLGELSAGEQNDFLFWNGDASNNIEDPKVIPGLFVHPQGVDMSKLPAVLFSRGNHDVRGARAADVNDYVEFPTGRPFYAFRSGPVGAIVLDTGEDKPDNHPSFKGVAGFEPLINEQAAWLEQTIQRPDLRDAPYRIVFCHIPLRWINEKPQDYAKEGFDRFSLRGRKAWSDALIRWKAQAIFSGHTHDYTIMPATAEFPYAQIIGGAPRLAKATILKAHANSERMDLVMTDLNEKKVASLSLMPLR